MTANKVLLKTTRLTHLHTVFGCLCTWVAGLSSCIKDLDSLKYLLLRFLQKKLLNPDLVTHLVSTRRAAWKSLSANLCHFPLVGIFFPRKLHQLHKLHQWILTLNVKLTLACDPAMLSALPSNGCMSPAPLRK
jgi:hypothetical protein